MRYGLAIVGLLLTALIGCASSGNSFKSENLPQLQPGVTTIAEASNILGAEPTQVVALANGAMHAHWRYITSSGVTGETKIKEAGLKFNPDGRLQGIVTLVNIPLTDEDRQRLQPSSGEISSRQN